MKFNGNFFVSLNVVDVKTFDRRSKAVGQEVVVTTDTGYRCSISAPDKDVCDLSEIRGNADFKIEPCFGYDKFSSSTGKVYGKNFPTFKIVGLANDIELS